MTFGITHSGSSLALRRARKMRSEQTECEKIVWGKLRAKRFHGMKFRRQTPIGIYIVDFICPLKRLVVEIDGESHLKEGAADYDKHRESYLLSRGFIVIRFSNHDVKNNLESVLSKIYETANNSSSP